MAPAIKKQRLSNGGTANIDSPDENTVIGIGTLNGSEIAESKKSSQPEQQRRSLFVRSLPAATTTESLTELFSESYPIKHATAVIDPLTKQCRGYGFVTFADAEDAQRAKEEFDGHVLHGKKLRIEVAEPRHRDVVTAPAVNPVKEAKAKREEAQAEERQPPKLIVRNLPWTIKTSEHLSKLFLSYGKVKQAYIPTKKSGLMAGFGFVVLRGRKNAEKALEGVNGQEVDGRTLAVDWAVKKDAYEGLAHGGSTEELGESQEESLDESIPADADDIDKPAIVDDESDMDGMDDGNVASRNERSTDDDESDELRPDESTTTVFVRNLPFTCTDEDLEDHFRQFGSTRYARVVLDHATERPRGTGFVCFYQAEDASACLRSAPRRAIATGANNIKTIQAGQSILQNDEIDTTGRYTMEDRVLQVSRAVNKTEANRLTEQSANSRSKSDKDKRRLYLLSEGTISTKSKLWEKLSPSERTMREASLKQRKSLVEGNPSLHLSLTRLSIRNLPRSVGSKELKALAREAVVGFAKDVKANIREKLSKEELARGSDEMQLAEKDRKVAGKGVVKQAKVVFEGTSGSKVSEDTGAGRSRGYGFIEYHTHRSALMGLRWLNGHAVGYQVKEGKAQASREEVQDRKKRLIVEFAIENAQVVLRRKESESKARDRSKAVVEMRQAQGKSGATPRSAQQKPGSRKRKRDDKDAVSSGLAGGQKRAASTTSKRNDEKPVDDKLARRNQIIGRKRAMRRARKG